jgi:hypothetical protein
MTDKVLVRFGLMGVFMAAPMVAWMLYRGHSWRDGGEMTAAMLVPMLAGGAGQAGRGGARAIRGIADDALARGDDRGDGRPDDLSPGSLRARVAGPPVAENEERGRDDGRQQTLL